MHTAVLSMVDSLIDNDEKVASSKNQHTQFKTRVQKTYPIYAALCPTRGNKDS